MRILLVTDSYIGREVFERAFQRLGADHEVRYAELDEGRESAESTVREYLGAPGQIVELLRDEAALVVHAAPVTDRVLAASPNLRLVGCARGGPVNVDLEAATARGIPVVTAPGRNAEAVADQTIAFMIMLARRFPLAQRMLLEADRPSVSTFEGGAFLGHDLRDHTLGLVGYGHVGRRVAARARAFGMKVLFYDPFLVAEEAEGAEQVEDLDALVSRADFVSLHARATSENENLFDAERFAAMKPGAYFVNTARETLVDEDALDAALAAEHIAGAALDVMRASDRIGPNPLLRHDNVVITPHIGGATHETLSRGVQMVSEDVARFCAGEPLRHVANRDAVGYG